MPAATVPLIVTTPLLIVKRNAPLKPPLRVTGAEAAVILEAPPAKVIAPLRVNVFAPLTVIRPAFLVTAFEKLMAPAVVSTVAAPIARDGVPAPLRANAEVI